MAWKCYSVSTDTWGDWIELPAEELSGGRALNVGSSGSSSFKVGDPAVAEVVTDATSEPLGRALVFEHDGVVMYVGLIQDAEHDVDSGVLSLPSTDIWWLWQYRHVLAMHGAGAQSLPPLVYSGLSLATIAKYAVFEGQDAGPSARYALPIVWPADVAGSDSRAYYGYKFPSVADALDELMKTDGGPDIDFVPQRSSAGKLEWLMRAGTLTSGLWEWDTTAGKSEVVGLKLTKSGGKVTNKVIATGEGAGEDLLVKAEESFASSLFPALERVASYQGINDRDQLSARARADLATSNEPTRQLSFRIPVDGAVKVSELVLGGTARVKTAGVRHLADGWSDWRLIKFEFDRDWVTLQFQQQGG
jgi:hypothetical protein